MPFSLRPASREDLDQVARVAWDTAWLGDPLAGRFSDRELFAELFVRPYLEAGACGFVVASGAKVYGYAISARTLALFRWFLLPPRLGLLARILAHSPSERRLLFGLLTAGAPHAPLSHYPAELHVNLLPEARGRGLGKALLEALLECLRGRGLPGVQLGTTSENRAALGLYRRLGFRTYARRPSRFWTEALGRPVEALRLVKSLRG